MSQITDRLRALARLRESAPLHDASATEAVWLHQAATRIEALEHTLREFLASYIEGETNPRYERAIDAAQRLLEAP